MNGFLKEWFGAYEEYSIGDFVTQDVKAGEMETEFGRAHTITCKAWLAPFDLGVSQMVMLRTEPTAMEDVFEVKLTNHPRERRHIELEARQPPLPQHSAQAVPYLENAASRGPREKYLTEAAAAANGTATDRGRRPGAGSGITESSVIHVQQSCRH